jgi:ABC-type multidrug transport system fused ATPase/permease subunit
VRPPHPWPRVLALLRPHVPALLLGGALSLVAGGVPGALVWLVRRLLDDVLVRRDADMLALLPPAIVGLYALGATAGFLRGRITRGVSISVVAELRRALHDHMLRLPADWHLEGRSGARADLLLSDTESLQYVVSVAVTFVQRPVTLASLVISAVLLQPGLAAVAFAVAPVVAWGLARLARSARVASRAAAEARSTLAGAAQESLGHAVLVRLVGAEDARGRAFAEASDAHARAWGAATTLQLLASPVAELAGAVALASALAVGGRDVLAGTLEPGALVAFLVALGLLHEPIKALSQTGTMLQRALAGAERVFAVLDTPPGPPEGQRVAVAPGEVRVEGVRHRWGDGLAVLDGVDLCVRAGERVALVGPSGAGKTTLLHMLARLRDPQEGRVTWDGVDLRDLTRASVHAHVGVVPQDPVCFDGTVRENVTLGVDHDDDTVRAALAGAGLAAWLGDLPAGLDTAVGEGGARLSGGQRQRLCLARALVRGPALLLLDEPTSQLDAENEALVRDVLASRGAGTAIVVVAHRLSTVRDADRIVLLEAGRLTEQGTHAELLARGGGYAALVRRQAG